MGFVRTIRIGSAWRLFRCQARENFSPVARLVDLAAAMEASRGIVFDTSTLFEIYEYVTHHGTADPRLLRIAPGFRYTTVVSLYEFLCRRSGEQRARWIEERARRIDWL